MEATRVKEGKLKWTDFPFNFYIVPFGYIFWQGKKNARLVRDIHPLASFS